MKLKFYQEIMSEQSNNNPSSYLNVASTIVNKFRCCVNSSTTTVIHHNNSNENDQKIEKSNSTKSLDLIIEDEPEKEENVK